MSKKTLGLLAATLILSACGGDGDDGSDAPAVSASIGVAGGTLLGPDGTRIQVPAGALTSNVTITIRKTSAGAPDLGLENGLKVSDVYELTPHGTTFARPVTISVATTRDPSTDPVVMAEQGGTWGIVQASSADGRVSWQVSSFSWFGAIACSDDSSNDCRFPSVGGQLSVTPAAAFDGITLTQAGKASVRLSFSAPDDCTAGTVRFAKNGAVIVEQEATLTAAANSRIAGTATLEAPLTFEDNGSVTLQAAFGCSRPNQGTDAFAAGHFADAQFGFRVNIPEPEAGAPSAPTITQQPSNVVVAAGGQATFTVLASADATISFTWLRRDKDATTFSEVGAGDTVAGGSSYTLTTSATDDSAEFAVRVCNEADGASTCIVSDSATLTVTTITPPSADELRAARLWLDGSATTNCAVSASNEAYCWGYNGTEQAGVDSGSDTDDYVLDPTKVVGISNVTAVAVGSTVSCAVHDGGALSCWGALVQGQTSAPSEVFGGITDAVSVALDYNSNVDFGSSGAGAEYGCYVNLVGNVYCFVFDSSPAYAAPVAMNAAAGDPTLLGGAQMVETGGNDGNVCVLVGTGEVRCGSVALGFAAGDFGASAVTDIGNATYISYQEGFGCAALATGAVRCWGDPPGESVGDGTGSNDPISGSQTVPGVTSAITAQATTSNVCLIDAAQTLTCWGTAIGDGTAAQYATPTAAADGLGNVVALSGGASPCALLDDGSVMCWGSNGASGNGTTSTYFVPTATSAGAIFKTGSTL